MRIALDATYSVDPRPSGIAVYSRQILNGLAAAHPDDEFLHCYRPKQLRKSSRSSEPKVSRRLLWPGLPTFTADLFHALNQRVDARPARKVVSTFHDLFVMTGDYSSREFQTRFSSQARRATENSDFIITVSQFTAGQVSGLLGVDPTRVRVVPHGVRQQGLPQSPRDPNPSRENLILFVGALQVRKNIARIVEAFEALTPSPAWRLVLAGAPNGYGADAILKRIEASACRDRIKVTGYLSDAELQRLYARASIFAFPSLDEGFGMPVLDAMAQGVPVLTSNRSALPEVAGDAALLVDPLNVDEMAVQLNRLAGEPELRHALRQRGFERVKLYSWERAVTETYAVYRELLG